MELSAEEERRRLWRGTGGGAQREPDGPNPPIYSRQSAKYYAIILKSGLGSAEPNQSGEHYLKRCEELGIGCQMKDVGAIHREIASAIPKSDVLTKIVRRTALIVPQ